MNINDKTILITGACGGIGSSLLEQFVNRGASKIYAADLSLDGAELLNEKYGKIVVPLKLDVTNPAEIQACRNLCKDVEILINNAGVEFATSFLSDGSTKAAAIEMAVNYFGVHNLCSSFWSILSEKRSSAIVNILSIASFSLILKLGTYCASKAAAHFLTQGLRQEALSTNVKVFAVYPGYVDTKMTEKLDVEKAHPNDIAISICDNIESDIYEIFPDSMSAELSKKIDYKNHIL